MPVMNGLDFTKALRRERHYDQVRILMVTSETEIEQVMRAMNAGVNEYLMKPFSRDILIAKLDLLDILED
jgi:two-component system chemotaxis response regulator CheY